MAAAALGVALAPGLGLEALFHPAGEELGGAPSELEGL
jgi:hypothetical protein